MMNSVRVLEQPTHVAPLGVRFWDDVAGRMIGEGLSVTAYASTNPARRVAAGVNHSGVYVLQGLPGLRALESGAGDATFWAALPPPRLFVVEVVDQQRRYQPFLFHVQVPVRGLLTWTTGLSGSPPDPAPSWIPLYSQPSRPAPGGMAVLRADLWNPTANAPAAWAVLDAQIGTQPLARGVADAAGRVALFFPYPAPLDFASDPTLSSPLSAAVPPLTQHEWTIQLQASYSPQLPVPSLPDLSAVLTQPPANLWSDSTQTQALTTATLKFGQELIVRSQNAGDHTMLSILYVTPA